MGFWSDLREDQDKCQNCEKLLYEVGEIDNIRRVLSKDGFIDEVVYVRCKACNFLTPIFYIEHPGDDISPSEFVG